jgi:hypothetical protein
VKRFASILLLAAFAALATGGVEYLHNLQHTDATTHASLAGDRPHFPRHDDSNCDVHRQLHMPALPAQWLPLLILLGLFVAFLTLLSAQLAPQTALVSAACRGPPAR